MKQRIDLNLLSQAALEKAVTKMQENSLTLSYHNSYIPYSKLPASIYS